MKKSVLIIIYSFSQISIRNYATRLFVMGGLILENIFLENRDMFIYVEDDKILGYFDDI